MARTYAGFSAVSIVDLQTQINAALALLPVTTIIRGIVVRAIRLQRRSSFEFNAILTYDTGGSTTTTTWVTQLYWENTLAQLITDLQAYAVTNSGYFIATPQFIDVEDDQSKIPAYVGIVLANPTAGASVGYLPLVQG